MQHGGNLELISLLLDFVLIGIAIWMAMQASKLRVGGAISKTVSNVVTGAVVLGMAHLIETGLGKFGISNDVNEIIHRLVILVGFTFLTIGISALAATFRAKK